MMTMHIDFHHGGRPEWKTFSAGSVVVHYAGREATVRLFVDGLPQQGLHAQNEVAAALQALPGHFAVILQGEGWFLAATDQVRAYPLFYHVESDRVSLSGCARSVQAGAKLYEVDPVGALEFLMSGYVTGGETVFKGLKQLQAGEALLGSDSRGIDVFRYYRFHSADFFEADKRALVAELGAATDAIFDRLVEDLDGRPAWVPLSAGLDSRLVAAKLAERGYSNVQTFSYGVPGNHEAVHARKVARALGQSWRFVPLNGRDMRAFQASPRRKAYWDFCDGLSSVPNPQDMVPLLKLREQGVLPDDAVLINGQSGDFSCGAHLPLQLMRPDATLDDFHALVVAKHYGLWRDMLTPANSARLRDKMQGLLSDLDAAPETPEQLAALHDAWEWQERQAKYVVNGQRIYDYLGLDWRLPLWEREWNEFWPRVPIQYRLAREMHRAYLRDWDYKGLFSGDEPVVSHWPGASRLVWIVAQALGLAGRRPKDVWYRYMRWFDHNSYFWRSYPLSRFVRDVNQARNVLAFNTEDWAAEVLGLPDHRAVEGLFSGDAYA